MSKKELLLKAAGINFVVTASALDHFNALKEELEEVRNINQLNQGYAFFLVSCVLLFHAQKFIWENLNINDEDAREFENVLYSMFEEKVSVDPKIYILDLKEYINKRGPSGEVEYLGYKMAEIIGRDDIILSLKINRIHAELLTKAFFKIIRNAWDMPAEDLKSILDQHISKRRKLILSYDD